VRAGPRAKASHRALPSLLSARLVTFYRGTDDVGLMRRASDGGWRTLTSALLACAEEQWEDRTLASVRSRSTMHVRLHFSVENSLLETTGLHVVQHQVERSGASDQLVDCALNILLLLEINKHYPKRDTWQPSVSLAHSDQTLGLCPVDRTDAFGGSEAGTLLSLMALFFGDAYK
jgi:hypothetical protein